jgi:hypothetical protein
VVDMGVLVTTCVLENLNVQDHMCARSWAIGTDHKIDITLDQMKVPDSLRVKS